MFFVKIFKVDDFHPFKVLILLHIGTMTATMSAFGYLIFAFEAIGPEP